MTKLDDILARLDPHIREAFMAAMQDLRDGVEYEALIDALERHDIEAAIDALGFDEGAFSRYVSATQGVYLEAGVATSAAIPTSEAMSVMFRFNMANPRAMQWISDFAASRVTGYTQEQVEVARRVIFDGYSRGEGPASIAIDIAGRVDRVTGRRQGGIIGLSEPQLGYVQSVRDALESGDLRRLFVVDRETGDWKPRYTRLDGRDVRTIKARIKSGKPLTKAEIERIVGRYNDRLVARRAEDVARTETAQGVMSARMESYRQALEREGLPPEALRKTWRHQGGVENARMQHLAMHGHVADGLNTPFVMPDGTVMQHSHDPEGGAKHNVNCRCDTWFEIRFGYRR